MTPSATEPDASRVLRLAADTLDTEAAALATVKARLGPAFVQAVTAMLATRGHVVVMGMGKSGHVGRKIAATLASTGTPAFFVHPGEAAHGDLGMVQPGDVVLLISNAGESQEIVDVLPAIRRIGITLVALTGKPESTLGRHADICIDSGVEREACPLNLAPTASTTAQLALGDALAVALLDARGFHEQDFARSHPGGALGRKLLMHVRDLMHAGDALPAVTGDAPFLDVMATMGAKGMGFAVQVEAGRPVGIFTDGDLRRLVATGADLRPLRARDVMRAAPKTVRADALAVDAAELMERHRITSLVAVDDAGAVVGALGVNDLLRAKVI